MVWVHMPRTETAVPPVSLQGVHEGVLLWETVPDVVSSLSFSFISIFISLQGMECRSSRVLYTVRKEVSVDSQGSDRSERGQHIYVQSLSVLVIEDFSDHGLALCHTVRNLLPEPSKLSRTLPCATRY